MVEPAGRRQILSLKKNNEYEVGDISPVSMRRVRQVLEGLDTAIQENTGYRLIAQEMEPQTLQTKGHAYQVPHGFHLTAEPKSRFHGKRLDCGLLQGTMIEGLARMGVDEPDIERTRVDLWINSGTLNRIADAVDKIEEATGDRANAYRYFASAFRELGQGYGGR